MIRSLSLKKFWVNNRQGYTLIELIIAIQLTFLIVGLVSYSLQFSQRLLKIWQNSYRTENEIAMITQLCSKLLSELYIIQVGQTHFLSGIDQQGDSITLVLNKNFEYNNREILFQQLKVQQGQINYYIENSENHRFLVTKANLTPAEIPSLVGLELKLIVESEQRKFTIQIFNRFTRKR